MKHTASPARVWVMIGAVLHGMVLVLYVLSVEK